MDRPPNTRVAAPAVVHSPGALPDVAKTAAGIFRQLSPDLHVIGGMAATSLKLFGGGVNSIAHQAEHIHNIISPARDAVEIGGGVAKLATDARHSRDAASALKAAPIHLRAMIQVGYDVKRMQRDTLILEKLVEYRGSQKAAAVLPHMKSSLLAAEATWQQERTLWNSYRRIAETYGKVQATTLGKMALGLEETLQKSLLGRGLIETGKLAEHGFRWIAGGIVVVGACIALSKGAQESSARTIGGRAVDGALSGGANIMVGRNPIIGLSDHVIKKTVGEGYSLEKFYTGTTHSVTALGEALLTGDLRPLSDVHGHSMRGENGKFMQAYANIGDRISKSSLVDNAMTQTADWINGVPKEFRGSTAWWKSASGFK